MPGPVVPENQEKPEALLDDEAALAKHIMAMLRSPFEDKGEGGQREAPAERDVDAAAGVRSVVDAAVSAPADAAVSAPADVAVGAPASGGMTISAPRVRAS